MNHPSSDRTYIDETFRKKKFISATSRVWRPSQHWTLSLFFLFFQFNFKFVILRPATLTNGRALVGRMTCLHNHERSQRLSNKRTALGKASRANYSQLQPNAYTALGVSLFVSLSLSSADRHRSSSLIVPSLVRRRVSFPRSATSHSGCRFQPTKLATVANWSSLKGRPSCSEEKE